MNYKSLRYIPLGIRTCYSLLSSLIKIENLPTDIPAIGIIDQNNMFGVMEFSVHCLDRNIKPIIGCSFEMRMHVLGIDCQNEEGYSNLCNRVSTHNGITLDYTYSNTLSIIVPKNQSYSEKELQQIIVDASQQKWYVGINENNKAYAYALAKLANKPCIALPFIHYLDNTDATSYETLLCIKNKTYIGEQIYPNYVWNPNLDVDDIALQNTFIFAKKCNFVLKKNRPMLPTYLKEGEDTFFIQEANKGLQKKLTTINESEHELYWTRLQYEINVIQDMKYAGYFLIVSDFIKYAKENNIVVGPGRGSGAGSLIAWVLEITDVDPIKFKLVFERFLNPGRVSLPDFDIDFCPEKREQVIQYVINKYGKHNVASIITFGSLQSKSVLLDVGRVNVVPRSKIQSLTDRIPTIYGKNVSLNEIYTTDKFFAETIESSSELRNVFNIAKKLVGLPRNISIHAAGIVISDKPLYSYMPLRIS